MSARPLEAGGEPTADFSLRSMLRKRMLGGLCEDPADSGAAALVSLLHFHGRPGSFEELRRRFERRSPPSLVQLAEAAEAVGLVSQAASLRGPEELARVDLPLLTVVGDTYVVVHEVRARSVLLFDPTRGLREVAFPDLAAWSRQVLLLRSESAFYEKEDAAESGGGSQEAAPGGFWASRARYFRLAGAVGRLLPNVALLSGLLFAVGLVGPWLTQRVVDGALVHHDRRLLDVLALAMVLVNVTTVLFQGAKAYLLAHVSRAFDHRLTTLFYRHALGIAARAHSRDRVGTMVSRLSEIARIRSALSGETVEVLLQLVAAVVYTGWLFTYAWQLGVVPLVAAAIALLIARVGGRYFRRLYTKAFSKMARNQSVSAEQLEGIATIKALGATEAARARWEKTFIDALDVRRKAIHTDVALVAGMSTLKELATIAGLYLAVVLVFDLSLSPGAVIAAGQYLSRALQPLLSLAMQLDQIHHVSMSIDKLDEVFRTPLEDDPDALVSFEPRLDGRLTLKDVRYRYTEDGPDILQGIDLTIAPGEVVAIVGRSGSGKTTLARLIQGLLRPSSGDLLYGEHNGKSLAVSTIRRNVGMVLQDSQLFAGSLLENIAFGDDRPDEARVREAARLAAAHPFILKLPAGYDTWLAEGGMGLSGGQRQRLAIARALYRDPRILILDEATSALDAESESALLANMREILRGRTALLIAHRLNTVRTADRIIVLDGGRVAEVGTHEELLERRGLYHALFSQQRLAS